jgi:FkbM family methyltransferase
VDDRLVYDVGAYNGDDTAYYLLRGYRVVSIEADHTLAEQLKTRFATEIADGRCRILNLGVAEQAGEASFYLSDAPVLNSFDKAMATRGGATAHEIRIPTQTFGAILREHGVPFFLKVDIEGLDHLCVLALECHDHPAFVSFEATDDTPDLVRHLHGIGYRRFRLVGQRPWELIMIPEAGSARHVAWAARQWIRLTLRKYPTVHGMLKGLRARVPLPSRYADVPDNPAGSSSWLFSPLSSGPIPSEVPGPWLTMDEFQHTWMSAKLAGILESSWFDVYAA